MQKKLKLEQLIHLHYGQSKRQILMHIIQINHHFDSFFKVETKLLIPKQINIYRNKSKTMACDIKIIDNSEIPHVKF